MTARRFRDMADVKTWNDEMVARYDLDRFHAHPSPLVRLVESRRVARIFALLSVPNEGLINRVKTTLRRLGAWNLVMRRADYAMPERMDDEWHLHAFDLAMLRSIIPPALRVTRVVGVPFRACPLRWVVRCEATS